MHTWVNDGKYLNECTRVFELYVPLDEALISNILEVACKYGNSYVLIRLPVVSAKNYSEHKKHLIKALFLPAIQKLTELNDTNWISYFYSGPGQNEILSVLNTSEVKIVLSNLLLLEKIDRYAEKVLIPIAEKHPKEILQFFKNRIDIENDSSKKIKNYEAIPFNFHNLAQTLAKHIDIILTIVVPWCSDECYLYCSTKLISNIFPKYTTKFNNKLIELINDDYEKNYRIIIKILIHYRGVPEINDICKIIISSLPEESDSLNEISNIMHNTGICKGASGQVDVLKQKKEAILPWINDPNPKVKAFAKKFIADLDQRIICEQRQAEEYIELCK